MPSYATNTVSAEFLYKRRNTESVKGGSAWTTVFGQNMLHISDGNLAIEMLDKKSLKYSSRPILQMIGELGG